MHLLKFLPTFPCIKDLTYVEEHLHILTRVKQICDYMALHANFNLCFVYIAMCRAADRGEATGEFCPGPTLLGAPCKVGPIHCDNETPSYK